MNSNCVPITIFTKILRKIALTSTAKLKVKTEELSRLNFQLKERCVIKNVENTRNLDKLYKPWSKDVTAFKINDTTNI